MEVSVIMVAGLELHPTDAVSRVSGDKIIISNIEDSKYHVVAIDCGMKMNIVRSLSRCGCKVTIVPWNTPADAIVALEPDSLYQYRKFLEYRTLS